MSITRNDILKSLEPMFELAEKTGYWFFCSYQQMWFHPNELRQKQAEGYFIWGPANWILRDPQEKLIELESRIESAKKEYDNFKNKLYSLKKI